MQMQETGLASVEVGLGMSVGWDQQSQEEKGEVNIRRWISSPARTVSVTSTRSQVSTEAVAQSTTVTRDQLYKIGLPGKSILGDCLQENRTSRRPFPLGGFHQ